MSNWISSGIKGFDEIIHGLRTGDNVVWQIDGMDSYRLYAASFIAQSLKDGKKPVYIRFAQHEPLAEEKDVIMYRLDAFSGFESFSRQVHKIVTEHGRGAHYVFDCLSDLLSAWATDLMIGNFFMVTCPYLYELDTIAFFALLRNKHSYKTIARIRETTQLLIDVYDCGGRYYVHPLKVFNRYSPTMFFPHQQEGDSMIPLTNSVDTNKLFEYICQSVPDSAGRVMDYWDHIFIKAEELVRNQRPDSEQWEMIDHLSKIMMTNDKKLQALIKKHFSLEDFLNIRTRIIGTGFIGGKTVGMLLARNILLDDKSFDWRAHFEPHDSYFVGSDVFYTYIVQNGWWRQWMQQKTADGYFSVARQLREKLLAGEFPEEIREKFYQIIDYFGQSPIIVRSSSLQEDAFGNAFAGKYESIFCANQGTPEERYRGFVEAVKKVYSSTMNEDALVYRRRRGLDQKDEQMALLVQRVSGSYQGRYFFPFCAGVGVSFNTFVWQKDINPEAGMLRLVFGLGTRAVNRVEGDYPRIIALDNLKAKLYTDEENTRKYSQHEIDLIDTQENRLKTVSISDLSLDSYDLPIDLIASRDHELTEKMKELGMKGKEAWIINFDKLLLKSPFAAIMKRMLKTLQETYQYPIDIEYTLNFTKEGQPQVNLVQCRPIQTKGIGKQAAIPAKLDDKNVIFRTIGNFTGGNISQQIRRIIYVDPKGYSELPEAKKHFVARLIGQANNISGETDKLPVLLMGPGRWGTSSPELGIPVGFYEINNVSVLCEMEFSSGNLTPEVSYGTHFFHDLVETGISYAALFQKGEGVYVNTGWLEKQKNLFGSMFPDRAEYEKIIRIIDPEAEVMVMSDIVTQRMVCFLGNGKHEQEKNQWLSTLS